MNDLDDEIVGDDFEDEREEFGCCFPDRCVMPGLHFPSECATAEMMEQMVEDGEA